jgi:DNA polymerase-3 subunit gamma/tau
MAHQVLARKWRPRGFQEVVGQAPVVRALTNALDQNRLHHAYLFTGTRGVGKTSIARLLAKCLNCEQGVSATPCGQCNVCQAIEQGRFLDLLEVDAASRTKVEDTRDLLDNVQYAPTQGRYKIYLIDEVHMLSNHSFNALLKTLEEPPPHVKFLLATTDPQRLPITVLSRCLQFHLKNLSMEQIAKQLSTILDAEQISYEPTALKHLAQAAQGSMRDALSLLDQAIAYSNNQVTVKEVKNLLGATEPELLLNLVQTLIDHDAKQALTLVDELAEAGVDFAHTLEELLSLLHQLALEQAVPGSAQESSSYGENIAALASKLPAEELQLYYQIGLIGRRDLPLAPTPRSGFEMVLLRMLAFRPQRPGVDTLLMPPKATQQTTPTTTKASAAPAAQTAASAPHKPVTLQAPITPPPSMASTDAGDMTNDWAALFPQLGLQGAANVVASHCTISQQTAEQLKLCLDEAYSPLLNPKVEEQIKQALSNHFGHPIHISITCGVVEQDTPAVLDRKQQQQRQYQAVEALNADSNLQTLMTQFNAKLVTDSVKPKDPS